MPELMGLRVEDPSGRWAALGFTVSGGICDLGGVRLVLGGAGEGITAWSVEGVESDVDGLACFAGIADSPPASAHPNGAIGLDHVVVVTPDFDRTSKALDAAGLGLRRIRDGGGFRQGFRRIGPTILELVEAAGAPPGAARFWGLVVIVQDLEALAQRLGDRLGDVHDAVQSGRRIATLRQSAGLSPRVAFMDSEGATLA